MQKKFKDFSQDDISRLVTSPAGQQLMALLQQQDPKLLQQAARQAKNGQTEQAKNTLQQLLSSPEVTRLLQQLGGTNHG